jgi:hypothetical protein
VLPYVTTYVRKYGIEGNEKVKPPRIVFYKPRIVSYRLWVLAVEALWMMFVNIVSIVVFILWAVVWLLWVLLIVLPARLVRWAIGRRSNRRAASIAEARDELKYGE